MKKILVVLWISTLLIACNSSIEKPKGNLKVLVSTELIKNPVVDIYEISSTSDTHLFETLEMNSNKEFLMIKKLDANNVYFVKVHGAASNSHLLTIVDNTSQVVVNELTTIASSAVYANFIKDGLIHGDVNTLKMGVQSVANIANPSSGKYGAVLLNGSNLSQSATMAKVNTLANLLNASINDENTFNKWKSSALTEEEQKMNPSSVDLLSMLFKHSWYQTKNQFDLFSTLFPREEGLRKVKFRPYLEMQPNEFALALSFTGGGIYSPGKLELDKKGNIWTGNNWMPGSQSNTLRGIGGGMSKIDPSGKALSPDVTGFVGPGVDGCGWGTAVGNGQVWMTSFNGKVAVFDMEGNPTAAKINGKLVNGMGVYISPVNKDVWVCDGAGNQMIVFKAGDPLKGEVVKVPNLASPFSVVIDAKNDVWVGNSAGYWVTKFNADNPSVSEKFMSGGISVRGLSIDRNQDIWVSNSFNMDTKVPTVDPTFTIMEQFTFLGKFSYENWPPNTKKTEGSLVLIDRDNPTTPKLVITGNESKLCGPWGNAVDGDNHLWAGNFLATGVVNYATTNLPQYNLKKGDLIHRYQMGLFQEVTDVLVDYMGHVWVANNWNDEAAVLGIKNEQYTSTRGGGVGIIVIYGAAKPIK